MEEVHKTSEETPVNLSKPRDDEESDLKTARRDSTDLEAMSRGWREAKEAQMIRDYVQNQRKNFAPAAAAGLMHDNAAAAAMSHQFAALAHARSRGAVDPALLQHPYFAALAASGNPFLLNPFAQAQSPPRAHTSPSPPAHLLEHDDRNVSPPSIALSKSSMHPLLDRTNMVGSPNFPNVPPYFLKLRET